MKHSWQGWNNSYDHLRDRLSAVSFEFLANLFQTERRGFARSEGQLKANKCTNKVLV